MKQNVLVIGSGGREHALVWKLAQSVKIGKIYAAPGNGGTRLLAENIPLQVTDFDRLITFAQKKNIHLTVVGPDEPLALGVVDVFQKHGLRIWGPTRKAARIESSKAFSKSLMHESGIPTAHHEVFNEHEKARAYVQERGAPIVVKASGLAAGKGVYVCRTMQDAEEALVLLFNAHSRDDSPSEIIIEEYLEGEELSIHAVSDGKTHRMFPPSQDHKTIGENGTGKNTGGMGSIAPVPWVSDTTLGKIDHGIVGPTLNALKARGAPFIGCLYPGLMMTSAGPKVLEYNSRLGDPETQVYMRLLKSDLLDLLNACVDATLAEYSFEWHQGFTANIVLASRGYPDAYEKGFPITGIDEAEKMPNIVIFHAGTALQNGRLVTAGGRVLGVSAHGQTLKEALDTAYAAVKYISFEGMYFRRDIGGAALVSR
ncbi:MAG: phosphoribosylamine--glycine ligase [Minisyncoccia bacterium]